MASEKVGNHRRDIQGLRAIAVLSVVVFHASEGRWLPGGFVGVDVFFVISGFLITRILLKANEQGRFSLIGFYQRRIRRLFPALVTMEIFTLAAGAALLSPRAYAELAQTSAATQLFVSNFVLLKLTGYFGGATIYKPLLHTWSLAVEEQFYIFFPIALFVLWRIAKQAIGFVFLGVALLSLALSIWMSEVYPTPAFYLAPTRAFELLTGALLAWYSGLLGHLGDRVRDGVSLLGLLLIGFSISLIESSVAFPGGIALIPCVGAAFVIASGLDRPSLGGRLISSAPFVLVGDISYSLYLWHWPLLALGQNWTLGNLGPVAEATIVLLSIVISYASWRWIELPCIRGLPRLKVITVGFAATAAVSAISITIFVLHGLPQRFNPLSQALFASSEDYNQKRSRCHSGGREPIAYDNNCVFGSPGVAPSTAVWADSHGAELVVALGERAALIRDAVIEITASACPPVLDYEDRSAPNCARHNSETARRLASDSRIKSVVMLVNFSAYPNARDAEFEQGLEFAVGALTSAGKHVTIFEPIPVFGTDPPDALGWIAARGGEPSAWGLPLTTYFEKNEVFLAIVSRVAKATGATVIPTADLLCRHRLCAAYAEGEGVLYFNGTHLSITGARRLAKVIPLPKNWSSAK